MTNDKRIARAIVMAQAASDCGKNLDTSYTSNQCSRSGDKFGYDIKPKFIVNAIKMIDHSDRSCNFRYYITKVADQNGYPSILVYFSFKVNGKRFQISFHNPINCCDSFLLSKAGKGMKQYWDRNSSRCSAAVLSGYYNL